MKGNVVKVAKSVGQGEERRKETIGAEFELRGKVKSKKKNTSRCSLPKTLCRRGILSTSALESETP